MQNTTKDTMINLMNHSENEMVLKETLHNPENPEEMNLRELKNMTIPDLIHR